MSFSTESHSLEILLFLHLLVTTCTLVTTDRSSACNLELVPYYEDYEYVQDGDIIIGGIVSVNCLAAGRKYPDMPYRLSFFCMKPLHQFYRDLQTFLFTIDHINKDPTLLPNVTLGYHIYDSCADPRKAIRSALQMLSGPEVTVPNYSCRKNWRLAGFIGEKSTITTLLITQFLTVYNYPVATQDDDETETLDSLSVLFQHFGWTWVGIITSNDESGIKESGLLFKFLNRRKICVGFILMDAVKTYETTHTDYQGQYEIVQKQSVQVIILCGAYHDLIFESSLMEWLKAKTLVLTPSWAPNIVLIEKYPEIFNGSLSLEPQSIVTSEFEHFIDDFYPLKYPKDVLLENLWMTTFHCLSGDTEKDNLYEKIYKTYLHNCTGLERIKSSWNDLSHEMFDPVYNAVISMAKALHPINLSLQDCDGHQASYHYQVSCNLKKEKLAIFNVSGENTENYVIHSNIIVNGTLSKIKVGFFRPYATGIIRTYINESAIKWKTINNEIPKSVCTESCRPGSRKGPAMSIHFCCYSCLSCAEGEISNKSDSKNCKRCPDHEWPNENQTRCVSKLVEFLSYSCEVISVIVLSGSVLLLTLTAVILGIFIKYRDTAIVRANNKNLSFVLLVSIMLCFLSILLFLGRPVDKTCMIRQISTGILLSISISSLLAKTIMVYIAFKATKPGSVWRTWTGVKLPNCVLLICSSVQGVICMSWVTLSPPFQEMDTHSYKEKIVVQCNEGSDLWFYSVLGYMGILATVSFITAFLARTLPDSFNEAKYITFSMLVFCSVWIAMIPAYLSTKGKYMVAVEIFAILTSNAGLLCCIFLPKCYIILCRPEINTKSYILKSQTE